MANHEIEIKVRVHDLKPLLSFLEHRAEFQGEKNQKDEYFTPKHRSFAKDDPIKEWLRLREEGDGCTLNYKYWHYHEDGVAYHCDEHEVKIEGYDSAKAILNALDFVPLVIVSKMRRVYVLGDYEVALDRVEELGDFVEVEYKGNDTSKEAKALTEDMVHFLEETGCRILSRDFKGYPYLLIKKYKK